jgi:hypothetical protein
VLHWGVTGILPGIAPIMFIFTSIMIIFLGTGKYGNKKIAMGLLTAYGVNFLINLALSLGWNAICGFPYFIDLNDLILGTF